jgi:hypothetical protein
MNYDAGTRLFRLDLGPSRKDFSELREVFPSQGQMFRTAQDEVVEVLVPGESVTILEMNQAFRGLPPSSRIIRQDLQDWKSSGDGWMREVSLQDESLSSLPTSNPDIPAQILALDQLDDPKDPIVADIGKGQIPEKLLEILDFQDGKRVATWKLVPWALPDRVWFVYKPSEPPLLSGELPELELNGVSVPLVPRLDYRPEDRSDWNCPIFFADVTGIHETDQPSSFLLSRVRKPEPDQCYLIFRN